MRRLARVVAIISALVALACVACYRVTQSVLMSRTGTGLTEIALIDGNLRVSWEPRVPYRPAWAGQTTRYGFCYNVYSDGSGYAWAPLWFLAAVATAIAMGAGYTGWRRRPRPGFCPRCAYDLRASPDHCPECGYRPTRSEHKNAERADRE